MDNIVPVKLREEGRRLYYNAAEFFLKIGDCVIVESDRGLDYGQVLPESAVNPVRNEISNGVNPKEPKVPFKKIIRLATAEDLKQIEENRLKTKEAYDICQKKITEHKLEMKLVNVEYAFDRTKIIFYFTAAGRVDFRDLVKDLAKVFKARIELCQIGVRDEAKLFGGFGPCGRELCCAKFLKDFEPVTIKMAKEQGLPLNPPKLSGLCGRLMCCLSYEHPVYKEYAKDLPKEGEKVNTPEGRGKVVSVHVLKRSATVEVGSEGRRIQINYPEQ